MTTKSLAILGGSGVGMIAAEIALSQANYANIIFLNDDMKVGDTIGRFRTFEVVGSLDDHRTLISDAEVDFFIAFLGLGIEKQAFEKFDGLDIPLNRQPTLIHDSAVISSFSRIREGCLVGPNAVVGPDCLLEENSMVLGGAFVGHDSTLRKRAHLATNAVCGANVQIGKGTHIGSNATIVENIQIGNCCLIGAGTVVLTDISNDSVVVGNPARRIR